MSTTSNTDRHAPVAHADGFCLADTQGTWSGYLDCRLPTILAGAGTTATAIVSRAYALAIDRGIDRVAAVGNLNADADHRPSDVAPHRFLSLSEDGGAGTDPTRGAELFRRKRDDFKAMLLAELRDLQERASTEYPLHKTLIGDIWIAPGATGGGAGHPMVDCFLETALALGIENPRVGLSIVGPGITTRDMNRLTQIGTRQSRQIYDTYEQVYGRALRDLADDTPGPDGRTPRLSWVRVIEQGNGYHAATTVEETIEIAAQALFLERFTALGLDIDARVIDERVLGTMVGPLR